MKETLHFWDSICKRYKKEWGHPSCCYYCPHKVSKGAPGWQQWHWASVYWPVLRPEICGGLIYAIIFTALGNGSYTMLCIRISWSSCLVLSFSSSFSLCHLSNLGWREKPSLRTRILKDLVNNLGCVSWGNFCLSQPPTPKPALFQVWPFTLTNCCHFCVDIQVLMGSLVYLRQGIENSPYVHLLDANQWADICDIFTRDACALLGLSVESPLSVRYGDWSCC